MVLGLEKAVLRYGAWFAWKGEQTACKLRGDGGTLTAYSAGKKRQFVARASSMTASISKLPLRCLGCYHMVGLSFLYSV